MRTALAALSIVFLLVLAADPALAQTSLPPGFTETVVAADLFLPTGFAFTPDRRVLIIEKGGFIKVVRDGTLRVAGRVAVSAQYDETGLLGIAVDPAFDQNGYIYVYYTTSPASYQPPGHEYRFAWNRVSRFTMIGDAIADHSETIVLDDIFADTEDESTTVRHGPPHSGHHNGGCVLFGPDGKLYISVGDAVNGANAQDLGVLNGKILRINPDGGIPEDNPFVGTPGARPEIWCLGLRNPWRFTFDASGQMFIGDVGADQFEEINVGGPGLNFGWPHHEGTAGDPAYADPLYAYPNDRLNTAIAAVGAHNGSGIYPPEFSNVLFFGDFGQGVIYTLKQDPAQGLVVTRFATNAASPVHFGQGPDGRMYYLSFYPPALKRIEFLSAGLVTVRLSSVGGGSIATDPAGVNCGVECHAFARGQVIALRPIPTDGYAFAGWNGSAGCAAGRLTIAEGLSCTAIFQAAASNPLVLQRGVDLAGDGTGDAFFYNRASGDWSMAFSNAQGRAGFSFIHGQWSPGWSITAGEFNGTTLTDFFLYNRDSGEWVTALATTSGTLSYVGGAFSPGWQIRSGRLDLDLVEDLFLYNPATGAAFECISDGAGGFARFVQLTLPANMDLSLLDANGNGLKDVLLYGTATGQWVLYANDGIGGLNATSGSWTSGSQLTVGDYDGNGTDDVLVYNPATGQWKTALSLGNGLFQTRNGTWSPSWVVLRARLHAGARDDLFLYNVATGQWFQCFTDGAGDFSRYVTETWSPGWRTSATDLNGDGADDLLLYSETSGMYFQCITSSAGGFAAYHRGDLRPGFSVISTR